MYNIHVVYLLPTVTIVYYAWLGFIFEEHNNNNNAIDIFLLKQSCNI